MAPARPRICYHRKRDDKDDEKRQTVQIVKMQSFESVQKLVSI